jgi:hypothetical protein
MRVGAAPEVVVVEGDELDPQPASTSAAAATTVPRAASLLSVGFGDMVVPDLLVSERSSCWFRRL